MMRFEVAGEVFEKLPDACFGVVAVKGADNEKPIAEVSALLHESIAACVLEPLGIGAEFAAVLNELRATGAPVLDYELGGGHGLREDQFFDGFHIDTVYGLPQYTATLLADANAALAGQG